jgi:hypothetical protein
MDENQRLLRIANHEIRRVAARLGAEEGRFVCECSRHGCLEIISLTLADFDTFSAGCR